MPHGLATAAPHGARLHAVRLLPGDDLLAALLDFVTGRGIRAAAVLTCVGSTGLTTLRPAGGQPPRVFDGKHEILSLTGTIGFGGSPDGDPLGGPDGEVHHLHLSISDAECRVVGGHLLQGCIVRTTAEIVLAELEGAAFERPHDPLTGFAELSIVDTREEGRATRSSSSSSRRLSVIAAGLSAGDAAIDGPKLSAARTAELAELIPDRVGFLYQNDGAHSYHVKTPPRFDLNREPADALSFLDQHGVRTRTHSPPWT